MGPQAATAILPILEASRAEFLAAAGGLSEELASTNPEPGRWSVLQCVEHVTTAEERFLGWLHGAQVLPQPRIDKQRETDLAARVINRQARAEAPEPVRPTGRFTTLAQALAEFNVARARTLRAAEERAAELYSLAAEHPRFGPLNGVELIIIIAGHAQRHAAQIREIKAVVGQGHPLP